MTREIPTVSFFDSLVYNLFYAVPNYLQGLFSRNGFWVTFWTKLHPDPGAVKFVRRLRKKYGSYLYLYLLRTKTLLVLDRTGIRRVLDLSPTVYAEPRVKRIGMSHFQPESVTISRGDLWRERRRFNVAVVDPTGGLHPYAAHFLQIIRTEVTRWQARVGPKQRWDDFEELFERIALQIIFGAGDPDSSMSAALRRMMVEANRVFLLKKSRHFDFFYQRVRNYLRYPNAGSLVALCADVPSTATTRVEKQITHWMFAMKDTLAENAVRTLAIIAAHPQAQDRVHAEIAGSDVSSAVGVDGLKFLEACIQETMRLWPTTPLLLRETVVADILQDSVIPPGTQVAVLNSFNHRDAETYPFADRFAPELWLDDHHGDDFNHFSSGPQGCAGKHLALFIAKAVLAALFQNRRYSVLQPVLNPNEPMPYAYNYFSIIANCNPTCSLGL